MVLKAVVKALKKADRLKEKIQISKDLLSDNDAWLTQQQLQRVYQQVLILDLEYALDKKVEQDLWNHGFKNFIAILQSLAKDKKNPNHSESQAMLYWCLEAASGFYLTLLHEICSAFDLDLPFRRKGNMFGCNKNISSIDLHCQPNKSSCYYICQHCLVHLGDIARYRNQSRQAEAFYRYAVQLSPSSGQPYNQLAILEATRGDKLSTVYHYVRSVAVRHPFPVASTNLTRTLHKHAEETIKLEGHGKLSSGEYITTFLKLHGLLHSNAALETAEKLVQILTTSLTAHIATESLSSWKLVQIVTISIFALHNAVGLVDGKTKTFAEEHLTEDEKKIKLLVTDFLAACLTAFLLPVYTIKPGDPLLEYFAMPAVKLMLEWIKQEPAVLEKSSFKNKLQIWPSLCKVLNDIQPAIAGFPAEKYSHVPLPEDRDLQGFLPLEKSFQNLKFHTEDLKMNPESLNKLRGHRLVDLGLWLSEQNSLNFITCTKKSEIEVDKGCYYFEATGRQEVPSGDQIKEIEEMILTKLPSPTPSEASSSVTGASTPDSSGFFSSVFANPLFRFKSSEFSSQENLQAERRPGILKAQNSGEKVEKIAKPSGSSLRGQRNVALQAIINRNTEETKQVTFKTPSPVKDVDTVVSPKKHLTLKTEEQKESGQEETRKNKKINEKDQKSGGTFKRPGKKSNRSEPEPAKDSKAKEKHKENSVPEFMSGFPPLPGAKESTKNPNFWSSEGVKEPQKESERAERTLETQNNQKNKQQLLSELFSKNKSLDAEPKQPQNMSGLLNLNKQQQKMLTDSKSAKNKNQLTQQPQQQQQQQQSLPLPPQPYVQPQQPKPFSTSDFPHLQPNAALQKLKYVDKMEAARKEYEAAMFALQQKQNQDSQRMFQGSDADMGGPYDYDRRINLQAPGPPNQVQQQNHQLYVQVNQPMINFGNFGFKYPQFFLPWQEPQEPPLPPSWWSETPRSHQQPQQVELDDAATTAFPRRDKPNYDFDWSYQPYSLNFPIYVPPPVLETTCEDFRSYQVSETFAPGPLPAVAREPLYSQLPPNGSGVQPLGVGVVGSSYSLFSSSSWNSVRTGENEPEQNYGLSGGMMAQQSFWSGPGPSPLERLLEQQKQMKKAAPDSKNGT